MGRYVKNNIIKKYVDWFYDFLFYYDETKTLQKKLVAIVMAILPIILAVSYIVLAGFILELS